MRSSSKSARSDLLSARRRQRLAEVTERGTKQQKLCFGPAMHDDGATEDNISPQQAVPGTAVPPAIAMTELLNGVASNIAAHPSVLLEATALPCGTVRVNGRANLEYDQMQHDRQQHQAAAAQGPAPGAESEPAEPASESESEEDEPESEEDEPESEQESESQDTTEQAPSRAPTQPPVQTRTVYTTGTVPGFDARAAAKRALDHGSTETGLVSVRVEARSLATECIDGCDTTLVVTSSAMLVAKPIGSEPVVAPTKALDSHDDHYRALKAFVPYKRPRWSNATNDEIHAMMDALEAEHLANGEEDKQIPYTGWDTKGKCYLTSVRRGGEAVNIRSYTRSDALESGRLAKAWADAGSSIETQRSKHQAKLTANDAKRTSDCSVYGDSTALERRCLIKLRDAIRAKEAERTDNPLDRLCIHLMCDGTLADALFRTARMPPGHWLSWQHKTTRGRKKDGGVDGAGGWQFAKVDGYEGMILVCQSEAGGHVWLYDGTTYHNWTKELYIGHKGGVPKVTPIEFDVLCDTLHTFCESAANGIYDAYPMTTLYDAERRIGKGKNKSGKPSSLEIERRGIVLFIDTVLGGEFSFAERESNAFNNMLMRVDETMKDSICADPESYRLTKYGHVFMYPEEQQSLTDLKIWTNNGVTRTGATEDVVVHIKGWTKYQFKSACVTPGESGMYANLQTSAGHDSDGKRLRANTYKVGDSDYYVFINAATRDVWCIDEHAMAADKRIIGPGVPVPPTVIRLYTGDSEAVARACGWTKDYHFRV
jgi:hypothetical protein